MVNIADLKNYILEEQQIEPILEELGCHHISHKTGYYQCANPDGDNRTALCIYENSQRTSPSIVYKTPLYVKAIRLNQSTNHRIYNSCQTFCAKALCLMRVHIHNITDISDSH